LKAPLIHFVLAIKKPFSYEKGLKCSLYGLVDQDSYWLYLEEFLLLLLFLLLLFLLCASSLAQPFYIKAFSPLQQL
jgi:hypothetical protein